MTVSPLTPREGRALAQGPFDGVPDHLGAPLAHWLRGRLVAPPPLVNLFGPSGPTVRTGTLHRVTLAARIALPGHADPMDELNYILTWHRDQEEFLDFLHFSLQVIQVSPEDVRILDRILKYGGSTWRATERGLERRVDPMAQEAFSSATAPEDATSAELEEAWRNAFGRDPNPSDAWDHAIKAVEAVLIPVVVPQQDKPQLGHVLGALDRQGHLWRLGLPGADESHSVGPPVCLLRLLWPNPDRHGGDSEHSRPPTLDEAQAVVQLAVTIVQWARAGQITRKAS